MNLIETIVLSIVEGITEFLPVSSTGHMIIASSFFGIADDPFTKLFTVAVQLGAILSVVVLYYKRFFQTFQFYLRLFVAFIPIAIVGLLVKKYVEQMLGDVLIVGVSLLVGGIVLYFIDQWLKEPETEDDTEMSFIKALKIGLFQILALVPGVSRSAATIIGGLSQGLTRRAAAEFAFLLAVPTMLAATGKELYDAYKHTPEIFTHENLQLLAIGNVIAFLVAMIAIRGFVTYLSKHGFRIFGIYRVLVGLLIIILCLAHVPLHNV